MGFRHFSLRLGLRIAALILSILLWTYLLFSPGFPTLHLLLTVIVILQIVEIFRLVRKTNIELTRFLEAIRYADFGQRFSMQKTGAGFEELGEVFTNIVQRFQDERARNEEDLRHLRALTEHVPVPLLSLHNNGSIELHNNAARRMFGRFQVARLEDLHAFGEDFPAQVMAVKPGERRLALFQLDEVEQQISLSATDIVIANEVEKLVSLQNIQSELDYVQLKAWQDLVRVLTHEIMNSITPVASLATTAAELIDDATQKITDHPEVLAELEDVKNAVETVARRSDGLMQFVQSYRRLTRLPEPKLQRVLLSELFAEIRQLVQGQLAAKSIGLSTTTKPENLDLMIDRGLVAQILLNLVQNSEQVLTGRDSGQINITGYLNRQDIVCVEVSDDGPGIDSETAAKVFVPFYTTKRTGSGVGLALTRQIMLAHGGSVTLGASASGGAKFTLTFSANRR